MQGFESTLKTLSEFSRLRKQRDRSSIYKSRQKPSKKRKSDLSAKSVENNNKTYREALTPKKPKRMRNYDDSMSRQKSIAQQWVNSLSLQCQNQNVPTKSKLKPMSSSSSSSMIQEKSKIFQQTYIDEAQGFHKKNQKMPTKSKSKPMPSSSTVQDKPKVFQQPQKEFSPRLSLQDPINESS